ncbi:type I-C CRISPR-associated protein Cas8c/Csd1 [Diplocloster hominis]|uniref:type I-C CRISPR-associated protein Cas8c/Csd1 n=1 Tax=Diplocloster hominis TaxID=3079010 RepID=UPI0031BB7B92
MGWIQELYETYENSRELVGLVDDTGNVLLPIGHSTQNAQVEVAIDLDGEFQEAGKIEDKSKAVTIIPVTENSGARSSGIAPHPLCDKLCYVAGDFADHSDKKKAAEYYEAYIEQLARWCETENCHRYVTAVYQYLRKKTLIDDLVEEGILSLDENGFVQDKNRIQQISPSEYFIRFRIQDFNAPLGGELWNNKEVYECYVNYYLSTLKKREIDYVTGEILPCTDKHPAKIRNSADKAKLISANDETGFTYRGRFKKKEEALSIGYAQSQEAHNVLRWLLQRQGYRKFGTAIVAWNVEGRKVPDFLSDTEEVAGVIPGDIGYSYAVELRKAILGLYGNLNNHNSHMVIMAMDAATKGRLSITYYQSTSGSDFLERLAFWHTSCAWKIAYKKDNMDKYFVFIGAPRPEDMVLAAYGAERNGNVSVDDKLMKASIERLLPCILDKHPLPRDMVRAAVANASRPLAYNRANRRKYLEITCAMISKQHIDESQDEKEEAKLALEKDNKKGDYLYGRLLAVAHAMEAITFAPGENRETNATRYTNMFAKRPFKTWQIIWEKTLPYKRKLTIGQRIYFDQLLSEIEGMFPDEASRHLSRLDGDYIHGYYHQLQEIYQKNKNAKGEE